MSTLVPLTDDKPVNQATSNRQTDAVVTALADGRVFVVWEDHSDPTKAAEIVARLLDVDGEPLGNEFTVNTSAPGAQVDPAVAALADGRVAVSWTDTSGGGARIWARVFDPDAPGTGSAVEVQPVAGSVQQNFSALAALDDGRVFVTWEDLGSSQQILGQLLDVDGSPVPDGDVVIGGSGFPGRPAAVALPGGMAGVTWHQGDQILARVLIFGSGDPSPFQVSTGGGGSSSEPAMTTLEDGRLVVVWSDTGGDPSDPPTDSGSHIEGRVYLASGGPQGASDFRINTTLPGDQVQVSVAPLPGGRYVVAWTDGNPASGSAEIRARVMDADGTGSDAEDFVVNLGTVGVQQAPSVAALPDGRVMITWQDESAGSSNHEIKARVFQLENLAPEITSGGGHDAITIFTEEEQTFVSLLTAADPDDPAWVPEFEITGGEDAALFGIAGGALSFLVAPDYENPEPEGDTLGYQVTVSVTDADGAADSQEITVLVQDVDEMPPEVADFSTNATEDQPERVEVVLSATSSREIVTFGLLLYPGWFSRIYREPVGGEPIAQGPGAVAIPASGPEMRLYVELPPDFHGSMAFSYSAEDTDLLGQTSAVVQIEVAAVNDAPAVTDDAYTTGERELLQGNLLANDDDVDGDALSLIEVAGTSVDDVQVTLPSGAVVTFTDDGSFDYDPGTAFEDLGEGETATDSFSYVASDGEATTSGTVTVTITGSGETEPGLHLIGDERKNKLTGGDGDDTLLGLGGDDKLFGLGGQDFLNGGTGADTMTGGADSDLYFVDHAFDKVKEEAGGGELDSVTLIGDQALTYTLPGQVEFGAMQETEVAHKLGGNGLANVLIGNLGNNEIRGAGGDDEIAGGLGDDTLTGNAGRDLFQFTGPGFGDDAITDFRAKPDSSGVQDRLDFRFYDGGASFAAVTITAVAGGGTLVAYGEDSIFLEDVNRKQVAADDFLF